MTIIQMKRKYQKKYNRIPDDLFYRFLPLNKSLTSSWKIYCLPECSQFEHVHIQVVKTVFLEEWKMVKEEEVVKCSQSKL